MGRSHGLRDDSTTSVLDRYRIYTETEWSFGGKQREKKTFQGQEEDNLGESFSLIELSVWLGAWTLLKKCEKWDVRRILLRNFKKNFYKKVIKNF